MYKKITLLIMLFTLLGCTGHIREDSFITQDKNITNYADSDIESWQKLFPEHNLKPLKLITQNDSTMLQGLFLKHPKSKDVIFFIQGNGMKVREGGIEVLQTLAKLGKSIVIFDLRGLGASGGKATIASAVDDSIEQYHFIKNKLNAQSIIVHGYSLGSFIAGQLAAKEPIDALVLQGSATNVDDWIDKKVPWYSKPFLTIEVDDAFRLIDNKVVVSNLYSGPLFVIGAENDEEVPVELSELLFNASQSTNKELLIVENAHHGNMLNNPREISIYNKFLESLGSL